jgi:hypothetical protein
MTFGVVAAAEFQRDSPGQQMRLGRVASAEGIQLVGRPVRLAEQPGRRRAGFVTRLHERAPHAPATRYGAVTGTVCPGKGGDGVRSTSPTQESYETP